MERALTWPSAAGRESAEEERARRLEALFNAQHRRLYLLARRMSRDAEEARDLVQEAFVRLARSGGALPAEGFAAEAWLTRTVVNLCHDRWRREKRRARASAGLGPGGGSAPDPESAAVARATVTAALSRLAPRRRAVVVLHDLAGESVADIARRLGTARVTVRWHLAAARRELRRLLTAAPSPAPPEKER